MGDYEPVGAVPNRIANERKNRKIIIILLGSLMGMTVLITSKIIFNKSNGLKRAPSTFIHKEISINNFELVDSNSNSTIGPITIDKDSDDGTKINLYEKILNVNDNKIEHFLYNDETLNALEKKIERPSKYMCEFNGGLTEDGSQGYDISCPMFYKIKIDKAFYGRYAKDDQHCINDYAGNKMADSLLLTSRNCGASIKDILQQTCEDKVNCNIVPFKNVYPDTCKYKRKYLHLTYHCSVDKDYKPPKFAIVMFANQVKPNSLYEHSISEFYQYSKIHGYKFILNTKRYDDGRDLYYMKLHVITEAIIEGLKTKEYDWIFWVDGDTAITNPNIKLETFLPVDNDIHYIAARDGRGLNAGVFMIRVNSWGLNFMMRSIAYQYYNPKIKTGFSDQTSMNNVLVADKENRHYVIVPQEWFNAYVRIKKPGIFLIHYAGRPDKEKESRQIRKEVYSNSEWAMAKTNRQLRQEVLEYYKKPKSEHHQLFFSTE